MKIMAFVKLKTSKGRHFVVKQKAIFSHPLFFPVVITVAYFAINLLLVLAHEQWGDEANPWQMAKEMDMNNLYYMFRAEAHPLLWYFILAPFAKLGFPFITINIISLIIMSVSLFIFAWRAPFTKISKVIIAVSSAFFYFNPVIARNYCLVILAVVLVATAYKTRLAHPIRYALTIALLLQSHFLAAGLAAILTIIFVIDYIRAKKRIVKLVLPLIVILLSLLSIVPLVVSAMSSQEIIQRTLAGSGEGTDTILQLNFSLFGVALPILEFSFIGAACFFLLKHIRQFFFLFVSIIFQIFTLTAVHSTVAISQQKASLVLIYFVFAFWTAVYDEDIDKPTALYKRARRLEVVKKFKSVPPKIILVIMALCTAPNTLAAAVEDVNREYSFSIHVANFMNSSLPPNSVILMQDFNVVMGSITFVPHLTEGRRLYDLTRGEYLSFATYEKTIAVTGNALLAAIKNFPADNVYCLTHPGFKPDPSWKILSTFEIDPYIISESRLSLYACRTNN